MLNACPPSPGGRRRGARARQRLLDEYGIEIGGGLGPMKGKVWRIGLMGESSRRDKVLRLLTALEKILPDAGVAVRAGAGVAAAEQCA